MKLATLAAVSSTPLPSVRLLAFAATKELVGAAESELFLGEEQSLEDFWLLLTRTHVKLTPHKAAIRLAINGTYATASDRVRPGDAVALIPPVSGG